MERIRALINKLHEQSEQHADVSVMMVTLQMLQVEMTYHASSVPKQMGTNKVAVVLPSHKMSVPSRDYSREPQVGAVNISPAPQRIHSQNGGPVRVAEKTNGQEEPGGVQQEPWKEQEKPGKWQAEPGKVQEEPRKAKEEPQRVQEEPWKIQEEPGKWQSEPGKAREEARKIQEETGKLKEEQKPEENYGWLFDPVQEIPTLAHQKEFKEMNDVFGEPRASLNDKLKTEKKELASVLHEAPVRDLKKAIGVNDRFVFLSELFRGDEAMYERSIKTINNFRIYPEAEYWIERELKVKLGWDENKDAVKVFRRLIKRRFS